MIDVYSTEKVSETLEPRASMSRAELQREWELMSEEERTEIYLPWLAAAKPLVTEDMDPLAAANYAMWMVQAAREGVGMAQLKAALRVFGPPSSVTIETARVIDEGPAPVAARPTVDELKAQQARLF